MSDVRAQLTRHQERGLADRAALDALLDEVLAGTLSTVLDGRPWVVPMLFARVGDRILIHGSTGAGALGHVAAGAPAALAVIAVDGLVVAHSTFNSSANYRSAVVYGCLTPLVGDAQREALDLISERLLPGRTGEVRPMTRKELASTLAMELPIEPDCWVAKSRTGGPGEPDEPTDVWCGVIPLALTAGSPSASPWSRGPVPASVAGFAAARAPFGGPGS